MIPVERERLGRRKENRGESNYCVWERNRSTEFGERERDELGVTGYRKAGIRGELETGEWKKGIEKSEYDSG